MIGKNTPVDLARDVIGILKNKDFNDPQTAVSGNPGAVLEIAQKICAGADLGNIAQVLHDYTNHAGQSLIYGGRTLLHVFAGCDAGSLSDNDYGIVLQALTMMATPDPRTGRRPFHLEHCDDIDGSAPLHLAARNTRPDACVVLLDCGADPNALSGEGLRGGGQRTPLEVARAAGCHDSARAISTWLARLSVNLVLKQNENALSKGASRP